jgi:hypothetical protein
MNLPRLKQYAPFPKLVALLFAVMLTTGASNQVTVTIVSNPPGALFTGDGYRERRTPFVLPISITTKIRQEGRAWVAGRRVVWPNGTITHFESFAVNIRQHLSFTYTIDQATMVRQKKQAIDECFYALRSSQSSCAERSGTYNQWTCIDANELIGKSCYVNSISDLRCEIAQSHIKAVCPNVNGTNSSFWTCSEANTVASKCHRDFLRRRKRARQ